MRVNFLKSSVFLPSKEPHMQTAPIIFASNNKPFSILIKLWTLSHWCHCAILDDGYVIDTTLKTGCRRIPFHEWIEHYPKYEIVEMPIINKKKAIKTARLQVGTKYDWLGIFSFVFRRDHQEKDKFFCSEQIAVYLGIKHTPWRLSPAFLYRLYKTLKGYIL